MVFLYFDKCTCTNERKTEEVNEDLCNLLEQNINQIANSDIKIILVYFNAKVGKKRHIQTHHWQRKFT
jgi:hypothetical protein